MSDKMPPVESAAGRPLLPNPSTNPSTTDNASSAEFLEKKKQEIVNGMLKKIKPFVGPNGTIPPDADFEGLAKVMEAEGEFLGRTLILTILLSSTAEPKTGGDEAAAIVFLLCDRLPKSNAILAALQKWLTESVKAEDSSAHLSGKILELLSRLHLTVDQLVQYKYGKLVKKLLSVAAEASASFPAETRAKAQELYDKWSGMAKVEDRKRSSVSDVVAPVKPSAAAPVENLSLFSEVAAPKTRAALILERAAKAQAAPTKAQPTRYTPYKTPTINCLSSRPMSADDIHKEKKRRLYLQEAVATGQATAEDLEQLGLVDMAQQPEQQQPQQQESVNTTTNSKDSMDIDASPPKRKKRVSFANEEELVQVRLIEPSEEFEEAASGKRKSPNSNKRKHRADYHHADVQEASYAFRRLRMEMDAEVEWREPADLKIDDPSIERATGEESKERDIQEARERQQISAVYFSKEHVPPSPSEDLVDRTAARGTPVRIRVEPDASVQVQKIFIPDPSMKPPVDLTSLFNNPALLQGLAVPAEVRPPPMPFPPMPMPFPPMPMAPAGVPPPVFPPFAPAGMPGVPPAMRPPFPFMPPLPMMHPGMFQMPSVQPPMKKPLDTTKLHTKPCKFYQPGVPGSCRWGSSCAFTHQD